MIVTYKYRLKDCRAARSLRARSIQVNQCWNWCVAQHRDVLDRYRAGAKPRKWLSHFDLAKTFKGYGKEVSLYQQTIQVVCEEWTRNRSTRFRVSYGPKRARGWIPFQKQSRQVDGNSVIYLGKRYRFFEGRRPLPENAKGGCFVEDALGLWYVCFNVEADRTVVKEGAIGIDLGLKSFATLSDDGSKIEAPRIYRTYEQRLAKMQRARNKQRVRRLHAKIKNCRKDFLHKLSTELTGRNAIIAVGNVNSSKLAKTRMAKSVLDAGWSSFRSMLKYKTADYREVDESFTTQRCSCCGVIPDSSPKGMGAIGIRQWECSSCGVSHDRDVNAARNILNVALSAQRPAEGSQCLG